MHFRAKDDLALYQPDTDLGRVFVPAAFRKQLVLTTHETLMHMGHRKVYQHLKPAYWWPKMQSDVERILKTCEACQTTKHQQRLATRHYRATPTRAPRTSYGFDFKGVATSSAGFKELCACLDLTTRRLYLWPQRTRDATETAQALLDRVVHESGPPLKFHSDHAAELIGQCMTRYWKMYGTTQTTTGGYHATGNAAVERVWRFINAALRTLSDAQYKDWHKYVSAMQCAWNSTTSASTGFTPFELEHGTPMPSPARLFMDAPAPHAERLRRVPTMPT